MTTNELNAGVRVVDIHPSSEPGVDMLVVDVYAIWRQDLSTPAPAPQRGLPLHANRDRVPAHLEVGHDVNVRASWTGSGWHVEAIEPLPGYESSSTATSDRAIRK